MQQEFDAILSGHINLMDPTYRRHTGSALLRLEEWKAHANLAWIGYWEQTYHGEAFRKYPLYLAGYHFAFAFAFRHRAATSPLSLWVTATL